MELIKQLKKTEAEARQMVEEAKADSARRIEQTRQKAEQEMTAARTARRQAIERAVAEAVEQGNTQVEALNADAARQKEQLQATVADRKDKCITRVMEYLKQV